MVIHATYCILHIPPYINNSKAIKAPAMTISNNARVEAAVVVDTVIKMGKV